MIDFARLLLAINVAHLERRCIAIKHDLTDDEREAGHAALDDAEDALWTGRYPFGELSDGGSQPVDREHMNPMTPSRPMGNQISAVPGALHSDPFELIESQREYTAEEYERTHMNVDCRARGDDS